MNAVGVIVEYNPFHNGHAFHLQMAKEISGADVVIAVMSGNFLQRGEPALVSKWSRTEMSLLAGVDLVFELPYKFATQKAETFANGAVSILGASGCKFLCFGSESGDIQAFTDTAAFLEQNNDQFQSLVKKNSATGVSYPKAISLSFQALSSHKGLIDLSRPNNILGLQYVMAIRKQKSQMAAFTVTRKNADYHDEHFASESIASATSIRKALSETDESSLIKQFVPSSTYTLLIQYKNMLGQFHSWENYWPLLKYKLLQTSPSELREIYEIEEGLENRLCQAALEASSFNDFMERIKTKRYTWTRLQRACVHVLTNSKKHEMVSVSEKASYLRLLGMTAKGRDYLNRNKSHLALPVISKLSSYKEPDIELDVRSSKIYALGVNGPGQQLLLKQDFTHPPIFIDK
ncbi:nucleotidyltransferase [Bacillus sp. T33-2]|uniref:nucleotidyltransferase n=1 Tax=Bacillus sp. T33-2 TaxID=2054168 RepID=UPI000C773841|nr:nucleotidyltransferase [Bacillus sp. T33-2]PLR97398.1 nucleotidyltransferase [Bacillus sp. T33-2]